MLNHRSSHYLSATYWRTLAEHGRLDVLQWARDAHNFCPTVDVATAAACGGHTHVLQWLHELMPCSTQTAHSLLKIAASSGHIDALDWVVASHDWHGGGAAACAAAAAAGKLAVLVRLRVHGSAWDHDAFEQAAANGQTEVMEWLICADAPLRVDDAYRRAALRGQRASLEWLEAVFDETPWDENVFSCAAGSGNVELLRWLHAGGCPWDDHASRMAAIEGHIEVLEWLRTAGAPMALNACDVAYDCDEDEAFEWAYEHGLPVAAKTEIEMVERDDVSRLEWLRARGHATAWDERSCAAAAFAGDLTTLALLHTTCRATGGGHDAEVCAAAAAGGHSDVLRWARGEGCAWDERVCAEARVNGHLDVLRWAVGEGCPCGEAELRCLA
ncbi:hypothetical protein JKP88DRAFT_196005 [Tribonema minus]|uniref:Ankyrin repeat domain containing protein n=1 Tax=Tribonema minus TaxID=303371 RepID=A0A835YXM8_9STRA|nr:hypothetical protein JKP88DRAFT_196005 [Tribonema minus]